MEVEVVIYQEEGTLDVLTVFLQGLRDKNDVVKVRKRACGFCRPRAGNSALPFRNYLPKGFMSCAIGRVVWVSPLLHVF